MKKKDTTQEQEPQDKKGGKGIGEEGPITQNTE